MSDREHAVYADYTDSHWYSGSPTDGGGIWIRDPIIDGYTELDEAMALLDQARKEVQAIQNALGTDIAGVETDLLTRLARRVSPSGHRRGAVVPLRGANTVAGTYNPVQNWWDGGSVYVQMAKAGPFINTNSAAVTFPRAYFTSLTPSVIVVKLAGRTNERVGTAQLIQNSVSETGFTAAARGWRTDNTLGTIDWNFDIAYVAFGGFPSS